MNCPHWCVINDLTHRVECQRCKASEPLPLLCTLTNLIKWLTWFGEKHAGCQEMKAQ